MMIPFSLPRLIPSLLAASLFGLFLVNSVQAGFIERHGKKLSGFGDTEQGTFSLSGFTEMTVYFAAQGTVSCAVVPADSLQSYLNRSQNALVAASINNAGAQRFQLPAGNYAFVVRNESDGNPVFSLEIEKHPFGLDGKNYQGTALSQALAIAPGELWGSGFQIADRFSYFIDGTNTGLSTWIIPESEIENFSEGRPFRYLKFFESGDVFDAPDEEFLDLEDGNYFVVARNDSAISQSLAVQVHVWQGSAAVNSAQMALATEQPSLASLGFPTAIKGEGPWSYEPTLGFMAVVSDGWFWMDRFQGFYWGGRFGRFDTTQGVFVYDFNRQDWIYLRREFYPQVYIRSTDEFELYE